MKWNSPKEYLINTATQIRLGWGRSLGRDFRFNHVFGVLEVIFELTVVVPRGHRFEQAIAERFSELIVGLVATLGSSICLREVVVYFSFHTCALDSDEDVFVRLNDGQFHLSI